MTTISVVVPTYNRAALLAQALESIRRQRRPPDEIVIVDDGSTDTTRALVEPLPFPVRYLFQPNRGAAAARNLGVRAATGQVLAFLDSDDLWLADHLATLLPRLEALRDPSWGIAMSRVRLTDLRGVSLPLERDIVMAAQLGSMLVPRRVWEAVGPLAEHLRFGEDLDWLLRARERGVPLEGVAEATVLYRHHEGNLTRDRRATGHGIARAVGAALARRRATGATPSTSGSPAATTPPVGAAPSATGARENAPGTGPLVSVILPVHNGERHLGQALASLFAQDYRPLEVLVIDDGSTDGSADVAARFTQARYVRQAHQGSAAARNLGLALATGRYIGFLDHDDLFVPGKLTRQVGVLEAEPAVGVVIAHLENFVEPGHARPRPLTADHLPGVSAQVNPGASLVRRRVFERIGPYETAAEVASDVEWLGRALRAGIRVEVIPDVLLRRRLHSANCSNSVPVKRHYLLSSLKFLLDQARRERSPDRR